MWGCYVWSEMMERTNHFITITMTIIRWVSSNKVPLTTWPLQHRVYTLLAIVCIFILCNVLPAVLITADMTHFNAITACLDFKSDDRNFGYSTSNSVLTIIGWVISDNIFLEILTFLSPAEFLMVCNSSINFLLYVMFAPKFRMKVGMMWTNVVRSLSFSDQSKVNRSAEIIFTTCSQKF